MSLRINHNLAAINANRNLKLTSAALTKSMQKLSSGFRINQAADDPAGLVISEQFRAQIAGLNRAIQNSEGSITMIQTAEGALTEINNLLISMRELAIHAANEGFNDADQLRADQAEIANAIKTIDRIAANTQFGTKKILDGSKDNIATITSAGLSGLTINKSNLDTGVHSVTSTKTADSTATLNTTSLGLSLANTDGDPVSLTEKIHNIDVVQASGVARKTSSAFTMTDAWGNGMALDTAATNAQLVSAAGMATIAMQAGAGVGTAGDAGTYNIVINYQENGESTTGNQTISFNVAAGDTTSDVAATLQNAINQNTALAGKVNATATVAGNQMSLFVSAANAGSQYSMRVESVANTTGTAQAFDVAAASSRGVSANVVSFDVVTAQWSGGRTATATVAAATYTSHAALVDALNIALRTQGGTGGFGTIAGGATTNDIIASVENSNTIRFATRDEGSDYSVKLNDTAGGTGDLMNALYMGADALALQGSDALVSFDNYTNSITSVKYATSGTTTLYDRAAGTGITQGTVNMNVNTALNGLNVGNLLLDVKASKFDVRLDGGPATSVTAGVKTTVFNADRSQSVGLEYNLTSQGGTETINNIDQSLVFQIGANVGQTAAIGIRNMAASSLSKAVAGNMFNSLANIDVTSVQGAQDSQSLIDAAINEVSTTRGTLGSFQKNTLESNLRNLRIASQNLTASESIIRDTDMAEEMSEFTKNQILQQTGMAMLAQSNQLPQVVLSLF